MRISERYESIIRRAAGKRPLVSRAARWVFLPLLVVGLLLNLGVRPLEFEEPRRALVALEMGLRGNLIVPTTNGLVYLNKPPLFSWVLLGVMRLARSTGEFWIRLPSVLSLLLAALALHLVARRRLGSDTAFTAVAFLLTFTTLLFYGSLNADIDLFFTLLVTLQALAVFIFEQRARPLLLFASSYLLAAVAFLAKGVPALVFQGLTVLAWLAQARRLRWLLCWKHLVGLALFLGSVGGYLAAYAREANLFPYLARLLLDSTERTASASAAGMGQLALQLVRFPLEVLYLCLPWTLLLGGLALPAFRARLRAEPLLRFAALFVAVNALPYWLSPGTRPRYLFPLLPFLAIVLAAALEHAPAIPRFTRVVRWLLGGVLAAAALLAPALPLTFLSSYLRSPTPYYLSCALLLVLAVLYWREKELGPALALLFVALACVRVQYDLVVPRLRQQQSEDTFFKKVAATLDEQYPDERIQLLGRSKTERKWIPILRTPIEFPEREWFVTSLSYYFSAARGEILPYAEREQPGGLYLVHVADELPRRHQVIQVFDNPYSDVEDLMLVRMEQ
ncbi:MAG TPA: glycosyltransferase family 39 protein [Anaeromyxobacter sp.]|nr:glycosyltransferase family 39 protein [Anaeromyxobacter sp.]